MSIYYNDKHIKECVSVEDNVETPFIKIYKGTDLVYQRKGFTIVPNHLTDNTRITINEVQKKIFFEMRPAFVYMHEPLIIMYKMFDADKSGQSGNNNLIKEIDFSTVDLSNVETVNYAFNRLNTLTKLNLGNINVNAFHDTTPFIACVNLNHIICSSVVKEYCRMHYYDMNLPTQMQPGGTCVWETND